VSQDAGVFLLLRKLRPRIRSVGVKISDRLEGPGGQQANNFPVMQSGGGDGGCGDGGARRKKFATRRKINLTEMQGSEMITSYTESSSGHLNDFNSRGSETRCCSVYT